MEVGGDNSWGLPILEAYRIKSGIYKFRFVIRLKRNTKLMKIYFLFNVFL